MKSHLRMSWKSRLAKFPLIVKNKRTSSVPVKDVLSVHLEVVVMDLPLLVCGPELYR